eukprot:SAG11_NODE_10778_length_806_cov_0.779349_2_plen_130_part_01
MYEVDRARGSQEAEAAVSAAPVATAGVVQLVAGDVVTPAGVCLARALSLTITAKKPLMVTGPNACGKTAVFRVLGGLWPLRAGSLSLPAPPEEQVAAGAAAPPSLFLVPQRIYCCVGSLADQICYPHPIL